MTIRKILLTQLKILICSCVLLFVVLGISRLSAPEEILSSYDPGTTGIGIWALLFVFILCGAELCWFFRDLWSSFFSAVKRTRRIWSKEVILIIVSGAAGAFAGLAVSKTALEEYHDYWIMTGAVVMVLFVLQLRLLFRKDPADLKADRLPRETMKKRNFMLVFSMILMILLILYEWAESTRITPELGRVLIYAAPFAGAIGETVLLCLLFRKYVLKKQENEINYRKLFVVILLILAAGYMFVMLPYVSPDEWHHYLSAYRLSDLFMGRISPDSGSVLMRAGDLAFFNGYQMDNSAQYYAWVTSQAHVLTEGTGYELLEMPMATNAVIGYFPSALGITVARLFRLGAVPTYYIGRFVNILICIAIISRIMKMIPAFRNTLFAIAALPMLLHLMASYSYDGLTFCLTALFVTQVVKMITQEGTATLHDQAACLIYAVLMAPAKLVYIPLVLLIILIPAEKLGLSNRRAVLWKLLFLIAVLLAVFLTTKANDLLASYHQTARPAVREAASEGTKMLSWFGEEGYTASMILDDLGNVLFMIVRTFITWLSDYFFTMGGVSLGWMNIGVPYICIVFSFLMLFISANTNSSKPVSEKLSFGSKIFTAILIFGVIGSVMMAMTYSWTPLSSDYTMGVQGRYFLPLLLLIPLFVKKGIADTRDSAMKYIAFFTALLNGWILVHTYAGSIMVYL